MNFERRRRIIDFLNNAEKQYPVNEWILNDIKIWPLIRICIFFNEYHRETVLKDSRIKGLVKKLFKFFGFSYLYGFYNLIKIKIDKSDFLFAGFEAHRAVLEQQSYNKYFDPIMNELEKRGKKSILFEYLPITYSNSNTIYKKERVHNIYNLLYFFKVNSNEMRYRDFSSIDDFFEKLNNDLSIDIESLQNFINGFYNNALSWERLWTYLLKKTEPNKVFILNYYSSSALGLVLASKKNNVTCIDMQHGGQGAVHIAYSYSNIPKGGYTLLPDYFWCWDTSSFAHLQKITYGTAHSVVAGGNPWVQFLSNVNVSLKQNGGKPLILFTLQTGQQPFIDDYLLKTIVATKENYDWWLRLHPRTKKEEKEDLLKLLDAYNLKDFVEIEKATAYPLPLILMNAKVHLTLFSGSAIEAAALNVPLNIIIGETGKEFFNELIQSRKALYFEKIDPDDFLILLNKELSNHTYENDRVVLDYKRTLNNFI